MMGLKNNEDNYRRAYQYLLDQVICYQGNIGDTTDEMWKWMEDDMKNARAIASEDEDDDG